MVQVNRGFTVLWLSLVVSVIVMLVALVFGFLDFSKLTNRGGYQTPPVDQQVQDLQNMSSSDEVVNIESDLNNTKLDNLDLGLEQVNQDSDSL